ncbi:MAG: hypothetical protein H8E98_02640 [Bacteroidetes bacterium]|nr:hypothetical protein [Bacteroidota bacterium]
MNKPELIKRVAIEMCHYYECGIFDSDYNSIRSIPNDETQEYINEYSFRPDSYEPFIPLAEIFVEKLITNRVIKNE